MQEEKVECLFKPLKVFIRKPF